MVPDKTFDTRKVIKIPVKITSVRKTADKRLLPIPAPVPTKNIDKIAISAGNAPPCKGKQNCSLGLTMKKKQPN